MCSKNISLLPHHIFLLVQVSIRNNLSIDNQVLQHGDTTIFRTLLIRNALFTHICIYMLLKFAFKIMF